MSHTTSRTHQSMESTILLRTMNQNVKYKLWHMDSLGDGILDQVIKAREFAAAVADCSIGGHDVVFEVILVIVGHMSAK